MAKTTSVDGDVLPNGVEQRIGNKLRLVRQKADMRLMGVKSEMSHAVELQITDGLKAGKSQDAIQMATLDAYREAVATFSAITAEWPGVVWQAVEPILETCAITPNHRAAIATLLRAYVWRSDETPWTLAWADSERFAKLVGRTMSRHGLLAVVESSGFERSLGLEYAKANAAIANGGRTAWCELENTLDDYLPEDTGRDSAARLIAKKLEDRRRGSINETQQEGTDSAGRPAYVPYLKAIKRLEERLGATPAELAAWVSCASVADCGGLPAYWEANIVVEPRQLVFDCWCEADFDYMATLMGAWFIADDVESFAPDTRFIEYVRLVDRWQAAGCIPHVAAYIEAKVREDRLHEFHPVSGSSQLGWPDCEYPRPTKETTLLYLSEVKAIELDEGIASAGELASTEPVESIACPEPDLSRREAGKRKTNARIESWRAAHSELKELHPGKSKKWCAQQIARRDIAEGKDSETIRRQLL